METEAVKGLKEAGKIAKAVVDYAKGIVVKGMPLLEIAEKIEAKIAELGGKPAFPVNLSINEIAAHSTPSYNDEEKAHGLLKVDLGVHVNGYVADTSFSVDLDNDKENKALIEAANKALEAAIEKVKKGNVRIREIGKVIEEAIKARGGQPITNLSGHSIEQWEVHAGITIPNYDNFQEKQLDDGAYAIEPFATNGAGTVRDGKPSGIYVLSGEGNVRDSFAREVLKYIKETYESLPFCSRWLYKKFGSRALIALMRIEEAGLLHHYPQLIEKNSGKVAQAEHTFFVNNGEVVVTTL